MNPLKDRKARQTTNLYQGKTSKVWIHTENFGRVRALKLTPAIGDNTLQWWL
ncbi:hypothetical protein [Marinimicrobium koreense]|uniref:hypothetical protein n=1 Tax=Marinimicrobium koreense TaxID=306545 RepID=UPI003F71D618